MSTRTITFLQPNRLTFGAGSLADALTYLAARIGNTDHGEHAGSGGHAAEIGGLRETDGRVLHLDPDDLKAHVRGDLEKDGIVGVKRGAEQGLSSCVFDGLMKAVHRCSSVVV